MRSIGPEKVKMSAGRPLARKALTNCVGSATGPPSSHSSSLRVATRNHRPTATTSRPSILHIGTRNDLPLTLISDFWTLTPPPWPHPFESASIALARHALRSSSQSKQALQARQLLLAMKCHKLSRYLRVRVMLTGPDYDGC